ncbi:MAG: DUF917 domain-containing protein [Candidatus Aerophobetes bacterium]|nr:DUF917 domain-containing protein [Candidatus Aerophobetes bacterium]
MRILSPIELEDILVGCTILGTGGGGSLTEGLGLIKGLVEKGKEFKLARLKELDPEMLIGSPYYCGSVSPEEEEGPAGMVALRAFEVLEEYLNEDFRGVIAAELGGFATAGALAVAAEKALPLLDADAAGRAAPDLQCSIFYVKGVPIAPMGIASPMGDLMIVKHVRDDRRAEEIIRRIAVVSGNMLGVCDHPTRVKVLKEASIPDTISLAEAIGASRRKGIEKGMDPCTAVATTGQGFLRFRGTVEKHSWRDEEGFTIGEIEMKGIEEYKGKKYKIRYKNENIISWRDGEVDLTVPDLISVLERDTGMPITNPNCDKGKHVTVIAFPAPEQWRTPDGIAAFGPKCFGYEEEFIPVERRAG